MALSRARALAGDEGFGTEVMQAVAAIVRAPRDPSRVFADARAMRALIAQEKGDADPWDLKLARGGLTDLDFIAQALVLAHAHAHPGLAAPSTDATFAQARHVGLLSEADAATLVEAHKLLNDIFQWQRLAIEGAFDVKTVPPVIMKRLAAVAGLPSAKVLAQHLDEMRGRVRDVFERVLVG
jgi:[glutamine synthetase] adenylyltransferase / [glutamine synthetase]-adenylyl-L-tyrosine phosphorylase